MSNDPAVPEAGSPTPEENLTNIRGLIEELSQFQKKSRARWTEFVSVIAALIALAALATSIIQYKLAEKTLYGSYLLQIGKDEKELSEIISKSTPAINDIASKKCEESRGDLDYSNAYAQAQFELDKIVDFFDFYYRAYSDYGLIAGDTWHEVCLGSEPISSRNCFYKAEWKTAVGRRKGLADGLALCGAQ